MTPHKRFQNLMHFKEVDRVPLMDFGPWPTTIKAWEKETGLEHDELLSWCSECDEECSPGVDFSMKPGFVEQIIKEDSETITKIDKMGLTYREFKENPDTSMPEYIDFPVKEESDWHKIKTMLDPKDTSRYPDKWKERITEWENNEPILRFYGFVATYYGGPSLFGFVRMLLGDEEVLLAFYDKPELIHDMMDMATEFAIEIIKKALKEAPVTYFQFFEDMCYKNGPLISPDMFKTFMLPRYKRITEVVRKEGVDLIFVDSDGDLEKLVPLWLESGINGICPLEQAAGNDIFEYRKKYGKNLLMVGGIDKRVLAKGKSEIDKELELKIPLALSGGYIPTLDHSIPPDVSYENFQYYWRKKKKMLGIKI